MSRFYPKMSEYGLSSDDDLIEEQQEEAGLGRLPNIDRHLNQSHNRMVGGPNSSHRKSYKRRSGHGSKVANAYSYNTGNSVASSVSLADFDRDYFDDDDDEDDNDGDNDRVRGSGVGGRTGSRKDAQGLVKSVVRWLLTASKWKIALMGLVLGLACAVVHQSYSWLMVDNSTDYLPLCSSTSGERPCLTQAKLAEILADSVRRQVHQRAGQYECGVKGVLSRDLQLRELDSILPKEYSSESETMLDLLTLIQHNPQWGIRWLNKEGNPADYASPSDTLSSSNPQRSVSCRIRLTLGAVWEQLKFIIIIGLFLLVMVAVVKWYITTRETEMRGVYMMVDRILDVLKRHNENTKRDSHLLRYLAIIHVRDMLIPPSERKRSGKIWEKACQWVAVHESRVRVENQRIAGEDFQVWRWIQVDPPQTEIPWSGGGGDREETTDGGSKYKGDWRGTAFEDYPPGIDDKVAPPAGTPSPFIRLKNMFEATRHMDDEMAKDIENSVLDRCSPHGDVVHVYIDRRSPFGCVYLKMDSLPSAQGAYKALHGGWYKGKLVTAKYIPEAKYYKWFPKAASARAALKPSPSVS